MVDSASYYIYDEFLKKLKMPPAERSENIHSIIRQTKLAVRCTCTRSTLDEGEYPSGQMDLSHVPAKIFQAGNFDPEMASWHQLLGWPDPLKTPLVIAAPLVSDMLRYPVPGPWVRKH
jgi:hypothetical protein